MTGRARDVDSGVNVDGITAVPLTWVPSEENLNKRGCRQHLQMRILGKEGSVGVVDLA